MTGAPEAKLPSDTIPVLMPVPNEPSARMVRTLEQLLEKAKSGELQALAYVFTMRGDESGCGARGERRPIELLGQLRSLERELLKYVESSDVEVAFDE